MVAYFGHLETCLDGAPEFLTGVTDLDIVWVNGTPLLYISTVLGGGVSVRALNPGMATLGTYTLPGSSELAAPIQSQVLTVAGTPFLATFGRADSGLRGFDVNTNGTLASQHVLSAPAPKAFTALEAVTLGVRTFLVTGSLNERGVTAWELTGTGQLVQTSQIAGGAALQGVDVSTLAQVKIGADSYVLAASFMDGAVTSYRLSSSGVLIMGSTIGAAQGLGLSAPTAIKLASIAGQSFALVAAAGSSSISVLQLGTGGSMTATDHVTDSLTTRFQSVTALEVFETSGRVFLIAGGGDDGLSLMTLLPDGRLLHLESIADGSVTTLNNVSAIAVEWIHGSMQVFAAGSGETGISRFSVDLGSLTLPLIGTAGNDTLTGTSANDLISGGAGNDLIYGGAGNDIVMDGAGADTLFGDAGADTFVMAADQATDVIRDFSIAEDRLDLSAWGQLYDVSALTITSRSYGAILRFGPEILTLYSSTGTSFSASDFTNAHIVNLAHVPILPPPLLAPLVGTAGADTLTGGAGNDTISGLGGADWIYGNGGDDFIEGDAGADALFGGDGQDLIYGGLDNDTMDGGNGDDTVWGGDGDDSLTGGSGADVLNGDAGNDILFGGPGADTLFGGAGDDQIFIDGALDIVDGGPGYDRVRFEGSAGLNIGLSAYLNIERIDGGSGNDTLDGTGVYTALTILGGGGADVLTGSSVADYIYGGTGNDVLYGGGQQDFLFGDAGADTVYGGTGNDQIYVDDPGDVVHGGGGTDRVRVANPAGLTLNLTGWTSVERIDGDAGSDIINASGFTTALTMVGNGGNDLLTGGSGNDVIYGNAGNDYLIGGDGVDVLVGGTGADTMEGGAGDDVFFLDQPGDVILGGDGLDRARFDNGISGVSLSLAGSSGLERLTATPGNDVIDASSQTTGMVINGGAGSDNLIGGSGSDFLYGGDGADTLIGWDGADFLYGDAGADLFYGGWGDDFFYLDQAGDRVADGGAGYDRAVLIKAGISINVTAAWSGLERIDGAAGSETINATGYTQALMMLGNAGADILTGGLGNDTIFGNAGADRLSGGAGGNDVLLGGADADVFIFVTGNGSDRINDWEDGLDLMDVSGIAGVSGIGDIVVTQSSGVNTVITAGDVTITLQGFMGIIDSTDFLF